MRLRLLRESDRPLLAEGFHELSEEGRYQRFLSPKPRLSSAELDYLTQIDQIQHFALGAVELEADGGEGRGLGVARFVCDPTDSSIAEAAVIVTDDSQGLGLGRMLFTHLVEAARARGVKRFRGELLASNAAAAHLLESVGAPVSRATAAGITQLEVELPGSSSAGSKAYELLRLVAGKKLRIRRFLDWLAE